MKESPDQKALRDRLMPGKISAEGFLGEDRRLPGEIIAEDLAVLNRAGITQQEAADRLAQLTEAGKPALGAPVDFNEYLQVTVTDDRGSIPCPFADAYRAPKRLTEVVDRHSGQTWQWSDLNIHMIRDHGFFEGRGSYFRIEPEQVLKLLERMAD